MPAPHPFGGGRGHDKSDDENENAEADAPPAPTDPEPASPRPPPLPRVALFSRRAAATARSALSSAWSSLAHWWQPPQRKPTGERPHRSIGRGPPPVTGEQGFTALLAGQGGGDNNGTAARAAVRSGSPEEDLF